MESSLLLETDQDHCYDKSGEAVPCIGSGQDGERRPCQSDPEGRFTVHDGVVTDNRTGIRWSQSASPEPFPMVWAEAFEYVEQLNESRYHGFQNWRLPSRRELFSLISHQQVNPALPKGHPFTHVFHGYYWTATPCTRLPDQAWYVHLGGGRVYRGMKVGSYLVWPVVSSPRNDEWPANRFAMKNHTITDCRTQRMWLGPGARIKSPVTWEEALQQVDTMNFHNAFGYGDWRLPNIRELEGIVDLNVHSPAFPGCFSHSTVADGFWSSTTSVYETRYAWVLYPQDGAVGVGYKALSDFSVWPVRSIDDEARSSEAQCEGNQLW
jgi:hypothetical protein